MTEAAEKELDTIRRIMGLLEPFPPRARTRILGYVKHFQRSPSALSPSHLTTTGPSSGNADTASASVKLQRDPTPFAVTGAALAVSGAFPEAPHGAGAEQRKESQ